MGYVPKGLWPNSGPIGKPRMFADSTAFTLPSNKRYNRAFSGVLAGVSNAELDKVGWGRNAEDFIEWWYAPQMIDQINAMEVPSSEGGFHTWPVGLGGRLQQFADRILTSLNNSGKKVLFTDWEGSETAPGQPNAWMWENDEGDAQLLWVQNYIAAAGKQYYDWHKGTGFVWNDKGYTYVSRDGTWRYINYRPSNGSQYWHNAEDWLDLFNNLSSVTTFPNVKFARMGLGYNNVTRSEELSYTKPSNKKYHAAPNLLFAMMTSNMFSLKSPTTKLLCIEWPSEDQGDRRSMRLHRFRPSTSLQGYVRGNDIRYVYSQNLYHDFVLFCCLSRNVIHQHVWSTNDNADPNSALYYCSNRGSVKCVSGPLVYNFEGTENYTCPPTEVTYIGMEGKIYEPLVSAHETYATKYKTICDGINNQLNLDNAFEYRRKKVDGTWTAWTSVAASNGSEHILAWKYDQPFLTIWKNTVTNEEVIFFWDLFATPKLPVEFRFVRSNTTITRTAHGNRAYHEAI